MHNSVADPLHPSKIEPNDSDIRAEPRHGAPSPVSALSPVSASASSTAIPVARKLGIRSSASAAYDYSPHLNAVHVTPTPSLLSRHFRRVSVPNNSTVSSTSEGRRERREVEGKSTSRPLDITGFKHLLMLVLVTGNVKMIWKDWGQFGFLTTLKHFGLGVHDLEMALVVFGTSLLFMPVTLAVERVASHSQLRFFGFFNVLQVALCIASLVGGSILTWQLVFHPLVATACEANVIVTSLKVSSFFLTNSELRLARAKHGKVPSFYTSGPAYPQNLTLSNIFYFWAAPTLVYQPVYPKRPQRRWSRVLPLLGEILTGSVLIWALMMQMAKPVLDHLVAHIDEFRVAIEDHLTLSTISIAVWLIGFVALFQSTLNLAAELTQFADRNFYGDWWNAGSVGTFWRDWNRPVSNYFRRHIYIPLRLYGVSSTIASNIVFFVSALLHELLFGVATHNFNGVAFMCMMVQPLFILATAPLEKLRGRGTTVGNTVLWITILFGQPTAIVIYYLEWVKRHPSSLGGGSSWWPVVSGK